MRILIDWDDVLFPTVENLLKIHNDMYDTNLKISDITDWDIIKFLKPTSDPMAYFKKLDFLKIKPYSDVVDLLREQNKKHQLYIVTATTFDNFEIVKNKFDAFKKYFPFFKNNQLIFTPDKFLIHADYIIDDSPIVAKQMTDRGSADVILVDKPWNKSLIGSGYYKKRVKDVARAFKFIDREIEFED